jgi:hypothetical protein
MRGGAISCEAGLMPLDAASVKAGFVAGQRSMLAAIEREHEAFKVELQETQRQLGAVTACCMNCAPP